MEEKLKNILKSSFMQNFYMERVATDLMDLVEEIDMTGEVLENYMTEEFNDNFTYGELYDLFKNQMNKADLESLLESMGHDFVDLDELSEEEKEKYYLCQQSAQQQHGRKKKPGWKRKCDRKCTEQK